MATRTVSQTGPLSDSATFGGSAFSNGDDIQNPQSNGFTLTIDQNATVAGFGATGAGNGNGTTITNSGVTLTLTGNVIQGNAKFTLGSGTGDAHLIFDTTAADRKFLFGDVASFSAYANCLLECLGTTGAHCTVSKTGGNSAWFDCFTENSGAGSNKTHYECTYTDFSGIAHSGGTFGFALNGIRRTNFFDHCTFDACAALWKSRPYTSDNFGGASEYYLRDCRWSNTVGTYSVDAAIDGTHSPSVVCEILRCSFDNALSFNGSMAWEDNYFGSGHSVAGGVLRSYTRNLYRTGSGDSECNFTCNSSDNYWLAALDHPGNPHCVSGVPVNSTHTGWVFDNPNAQAIDSGECFYTGVGGLTLRYNLAIPGEEDGLAIGNMAHHGTTPTGDPWIVEHNTVVGSNNAYIVFSEQGVDLGTIYGSVKSNLVVDLVGNAAAVQFDLGYLDNDQVDLCNPAETTHNGGYGTETFNDPVTADPYDGYRGAFSAAPGANDIRGNPNFVDATRNFANWAVYKGAADGGDSLATRTAAAEALVFADPTLIADDLIPWVRAGFAPTNPIYQNAGHDAVTTGAVEFQEIQTGGAQRLEIRIGQPAMIRGF